MANSNNKMSNNKKATPKTGKQPPRRKDIKKQRWASIVAAILAFGMIASVGFMGLEYILGRNQDPGQNWTPDDYLEYYTTNITNLESLLEEMGPNELFLEQLAENYNGLIMIRQFFFDDAEQVKLDQQKLAGIYEDLIQMVPHEPAYYLELLYVYSALEESEEKILETAAVLSEMLREEPNPDYTLSLLRFYSGRELDELLQDEAAWLQEYLEERLAADEVENQDRYRYAVLMGDYLNGIDAALEQLALVLASEDEENELYQRAVNYRNQISDNEDDANGEDE